MRQTTVRWIAIAVVAALIGTLAIGFVVGRNADAPAGGEEGTGAGTGADTAQVDAATDGPHVIVELCNDQACPRQDEDQQQALAEAVRGDPRVLSVRFVTLEQAHELFLAEVGDREDLIEDVAPGDIPARLEVELYDPATADEVVAELSDREGVATAHAPPTDS